MLHTQTRSSNI